MPVDFYYSPASGPCRAALLTAKAVGLELNLKELNLLHKDQMKPEFLAINPLHCVPTIVDGDLTIWESRAICTYFASQYGKDDCLYPKDPKIRAKVDHLLYFDMGTLYKRFADYAYPVLFGGQPTPDPSKLTPLHEVLEWLDQTFEGHKWAVGDSITVADCVLVASVSTFEAAGIDLSGYSYIVRWLENSKKSLCGYNEVNAPGAAGFGAFAKKMLNKS